MRRSGKSLFNSVVNINSNYINNYLSLVVDHRLPYRALLVYNSFADPTYMELWYVRLDFQFYNPFIMRSIDQNSLHRYLMFAKTMIFVNRFVRIIFIMYYYFIHTTMKITLVCYILILFLISMIFFL